MRSSQSYPASDPEDTFTFIYNKPDVPATAINLGDVTINRSSVVICPDSASSFVYAKIKSQALGGNAFYVARYRKTADRQGEMAGYELDGDMLRLQEGAPSDALSGSSATEGGGSSMPALSAGEVATLASIPATQPPLESAPVDAAPVPTPQPDETPVNLGDFHFYGSTDEVPAGTRVVRYWDIAKSKYANTCDSAAVFAIAENEARRLGADGFMIIRLTRASTGGGVCYYLAGNILASSEGETPPLQSAVYDNVGLSAPGAKPRPDIGWWSAEADISVAFRTASISGSVSAQERHMLEQLKKGWSWGLTLTRYFDKGFGVGFTFLNYAASAEGPVSDGNQMTLQMVEKDNIIFAGPTFAGRGMSANGRFVFTSSVGLGYLAYASKMYPQGYPSVVAKMNGGTLGLYFSLGGDYRFAKNVGIGLKISGVTGSLNKVTITDVNEYKEEKKLADGESESLANISLGGGLRFYF
ncbi:hypothetical protein FACS1894159_06210 [Bacteroidia bacterium]|nr:hypothetical protein FACS1894159_06210 [Bacteroidia bacterium]